jgi:glycosyltransferase involved in cell wall biosynthesis
MRLIWHSVAPFTPSGYGQQTAVFTPRLRDLGHEIILSTWWGLNGSALEYEGMKLLPGDQKYGNVLLPAYAELYKPDAVIALMDAWVLQPDRMRDLPLAVWVPVDHKPCPTRVHEFFKLTGARPIAMSKFGERMLRDEGLDPLYVPHGIDTEVFQYRPEAREKLRKAWGAGDDFIVGMVAHNSGGTGSTGISRKSFPQAFIAFKNLLELHPEAKLYLHTEMTGRPGLENGLYLPGLLERFEIPATSVLITNQLGLEMGIEPTDMAGLYSAFDVLLNPSFGEGFGIPIVEAQACGTPVIVTDWTSMPELCGSGWLVQGEPWFDTREGAGNAFFKCPSILSILEALEAAYNAKGDQAYRDRARKFALDYDADLVTEKYWKPALETLSKPREIAPLGNRAHRRAKKKVAA